MSRRQHARKIAIPKPPARAPRMDAAIKLATELRNEETRERARAALADISQREFPFVDEEIPFTEDEPRSLSHATVRRHERNAYLNAIESALVEMKASLDEMATDERELCRCVRHREVCLCVASGIARGFRQKAGGLVALLDAVLAMRPVRNGSTEPVQGAQVEG